MTNPAVPLALEGESSHMLLVLEDGGYLLLEGEGTGHLPDGLDYRVGDHRPHFRTGNHRIHFAARSGMSITLTQLPTLSVGSARLARVNMSDDLDEDARLAGAPVVEEISTEDLTIEDEAVNTQEYFCTASKTQVAVGKAVQFSVRGGVAGTRYRVRVTVVTDSTPAETLVYDLLLTWR